MGQLIEGMGKINQKVEVEEVERLSFEFSKLSAELDELRLRLRTQKTLDKASGGVWMATSMLDRLFHDHDSLDSIVDHLDRIAESLTELEAQQ